MSGTDERGFEKERVGGSEDGTGVEVDAPEGSVVEVEVEVGVGVGVVGSGVGGVVVEIVEDGLVIAEERDCVVACNGFLREISSCSGLSNCYI